MAPDQTQRMSSLPVFYNYHVYVQLMDPQLAYHVGMARLGWHHVNMSERQQLR